MKNTSSIKKRLNNFVRHQYYGYRLATVGDKFNATAVGKCLYKTIAEKGARFVRAKSYAAYR